MIHLIRYYMRRGGLRWLPILFAIGVILPLISWLLFGKSRGLENESVAFLPFMMVMGMGPLLALGLWEAEEFDLALPFRRKTIFMAKNLAILLTVLLYTAPFGSAIVAIAYLQGTHLERTFVYAKLALGWTAILLMANAAQVLVKRTPPLLKIPALLGVAFIAVIVLVPSISTSWSLMQPALAVTVGALAWFLGAHLFNRLELVPNPEGASLPLAGSATCIDTRSSPSARARIFLPLGTAGPVILDNVSPFVRFMARSLWLRWWYLLLVVFMAGFNIYGATNPFGAFWTFIIGGAIGAAWLPQLFNEACKGCLPFVRRRTIFRSVMSPIVAALLLTGGIAALAGDSPAAIVACLAAVPVIVFWAWAILPAPSEYSRPFVLRVRSMVHTFLWICVMFGLFFQNWIAGFKFLKNKAISEIGPPLLRNPLLLTCTILLAIAFLWWRCERKFDHFEPTSRPSALPDAV